MSRKNSKEGRISQQNKAKILAAAETEFAMHGYNGTRLQQIADRAELPKTNVLYYFKSKKQLYLTILERILSKWNSAFDLAKTTDDPAEVLAHYIAEKMELSRLDPQASKIFALEIINGATNLNSFYQRQHTEWMESRVALLQNWIDQGVLHTRNPHYLLYHIWACSQHYADFSAQIEVLQGKKMEQREFTDATKALVQLILTGCGLLVPEKYR